MVLDCESTLVVITYNIHSAMPDNRLEAISAELENVNWDLLVLVETWREASTEQFNTESGHTWYGSGGCKVVVVLVSWHTSVMKTIALNL